MITRTFYKATGSVVEPTIEKGKPTFKSIIDSFEIFTTSKVDQFSVLKKLKKTYSEITPRSLVTDFKVTEQILGVSDDDFIKASTPIERYKNKEDNSNEQ